MKSYTKCCFIFWALYVCAPLEAKNRSASTVKKTTQKATKRKKTKASPHKKRLIEGMFVLTAIALAAEGCYVCYNNNLNENEEDDQNTNNSTENNSNKNEEKNDNNQQNSLENLKAAIKKEDWVAFEPAHFEALAIEVVKDLKKNKQNINVENLKEPVIQYLEDNELNLTKDLNNNYPNPKFWLGRVAGHITNLMQEISSDDFAQVMDALFTILKEAKGKDFLKEKLNEPDDQARAFHHQIVLRGDTMENADKPCGKFDCLPTLIMLMQKYPIEKFHNDPDGNPYQYTLASCGASKHTVLKKDDKPYILNIFPWWPDSDQAPTYIPKDTDPDKVKISASIPNTGQSLIEDLDLSK